MRPSYYRISLDIHDTTSQLSFSIKKGDTSRRLLISLTDDGVPYTITSDCYAVFSARKPDGNIVFNDCTIKNNIIIYDVTEQTTLLEGRLDCEITLYGQNSDQITSPRFTIIVYAAVFSEQEVESSSEYKSLAQLVTEGTALMEDFRNGLDGLATSDELDALAIKHTEDLESALAQHDEDLKEYVKEEALAGYAKKEAATSSGGSSAANGKLGLTRYKGANYGGLNIDSNGCVSLYAEPNPKRTRQKGVDTLAVTTVYFNEFLKEALAGDTYPLELTDEEKATACEILGVANNAGGGSGGNGVFKAYHLEADQSIFGADIIRANADGSPKGEIEIWSYSPFTIGFPQYNYNVAENVYYFKAFYFVIEYPETGVEHFKTRHAMVICQDGILKSIDNAGPSESFYITNNVLATDPDCLKKIYVNFTPIEEETV